MLEVFETIKSSFSLDIGLIVYLATFGYVLGFLFKNQLVLRLLVFISTFIYIIYYYFYPEIPLWGAIISSSLILVANIIGTVSILYDRFPFSIDEEYIPIFKSLKGITPGEFRRLLKISTLNKSKNDTLLTEEDKQPTHLFYLLNCEAFADKNKHQFTIPSGSFIGEISFILKGNNASATVRIKIGCTYLSWKRTELEGLLLKEPNLQQAFEARIARDMADKLTISQSH